MKIDAYLVDDQWQAMGDPVDDEMLRTLAVVAEPDGVLPALVERFGGAADRVGVSALSPGSEPSCRR